MYGWEPMKGWFESVNSFTIVSLKWVCFLWTIDWGINAKQHWEQKYCDLECFGYLKRCNPNPREMYTVSPVDSNSSAKHGFWTKRCQTYFMWCLTMETDTSGRLPLPLPRNIRRLSLLASSVEKYQPRKRGHKGATEGIQSWSNFKG